MNTAAMIAVVTSKPAIQVYKNVGKYGVKLAAGIGCEVVTYFAGQKIIKSIKEKTNFEDEKVLIIKERVVKAEA